MNLLHLEQLSIAYGPIKALHAINLEVHEGEIISLLGANGAGKSTTLRAISRLIPVLSGKINYKGKNLLEYQPHTVVAQGIAHVPEGRGIFPGLTVLQNLQLAGWTVKHKKQLKLNYESVFNLFPRLAERIAQSAGTLSGGEQQMLAVARALMTNCRLMLLDEPSMGLSPLLVKEVFRVLREINKRGTTILLVEQNANMALKIAHRGYVLENGRIVLCGSASELMQDHRIIDAYLGAAKK
ncbi:ABC transporter ATP-binding protein [Candidatus Desantisbacteria bacterium]|nr:ABC transporter ATP-binding protein [Candidatus Desantisbacteria bacterium]